MPKPPSPLVMLTLMVDIFGGAKALEHVALPSQPAPPESGTVEIRTSARASPVYMSRRWPMAAGFPKWGADAETTRGPPPRTMASACEASPELQVVSGALDQEELNMACGGRKPSLHRRFLDGWGTTQGSDRAAPVQLVSP